MQLFPSVFYSVFCEAASRLTAQTVGQLFTANFSQQEERLSRETPVITYWRHFLLECEGTAGSLHRDTRPQEQVEKKISVKEGSTDPLLSSLLSPVSSPQLGRAPSPSRTCFTSPPELRSSQRPASSLIPPSPSFIHSLLPNQELRRRRPDMRGRSRGTWAFSLKVNLVPNTCSCLSPPPTRPSKAPWSRPSATTCTSSPQTFREVLVDCSCS